MAALTAFLDEIWPQMGDAPDPTLTAAVRWAVRRFCFRASAYRVDLADLALTLNSAGPYDVALPADAVLIDYLRAKQNGIPVAIVRKQDMDDLNYDWESQTGGQVQAVYPVSTTQIYVWPIPTDITYPVKIRAALSLAETATTCPDFILNEWKETIVAGAIGRLRTQTDQPWTDKKDGADRLAEFWNGVENAMLQVERGYSSTPRFAKVPFFA